LPIGQVKRIYIKVNIMNVKTIENELNKGLNKVAELEKQIKEAALLVEVQEKEAGEKVLAGGNIGQVGKELANAKRAYSTLEATLKAANERISKKRIELREAQTKAAKKRMAEIRKETDVLIDGLVGSYKAVLAVNEKLRKLANEARTIKGEYGIPPAHSLLSGAAAGINNNAAAMLGELKKVYPGIYEKAK